MVAVGVHAPERREPSGLWEAPRAVGRELVAFDPVDGDERAVVEEMQDAVARAALPALLLSLTRGPLLFRHLVAEIGEMLRLRAGAAAAGELLRDVHLGHASLPLPIAID